MTSSQPSEPRGPYPPNDPERPRDPYYAPWYRRYWTYGNRPYAGCGCFYVVLAFLALWFVLSLFMPALAIWGTL